ncbi:hypothetical protein J4573_44970 [Actinomadura barringtoniae]|uniref:Uncharacterized protein n=1 Tax=Actinomadura barringtoniae TaxID=1427535 RepID=A0A939PKH3_9ACTN|nr:hypothetical protein [Actinomadura barringtoniae]MBO2454305.1 hypothetical protein [Actinomadura barringtoniae]
MGNQIYVDPDGISKHGKELKEKYVTQLEKVGEDMSKDGVYNLEGGAFSITCTMASVAYPGAIQFVFQDLKTHIEMLDGYAGNIEVTAKNYQGAEDASRITG